MGVAQSNTGLNSWNRILKCVAGAMEGVRKGVGKV